MDLLDRHNVSADKVFSITADGAEGLDASVPYDTTQILKAMPGYTAGTVLIGLETEAVNALVLFNDATGTKAQIFQIVPTPDNKIAQIHGVAQQVSGPAGERPGMTFAAARVNPATCRMGTNLWAGLAICKSSAAANVLLTFSFRGLPANLKGLPKDSDLANGELQRIIWTPPT